MADQPPPVVKAYERLKAEIQQLFKKDVNGVFRKVYNMDGFENAVAFVSKRERWETVVVPDFTDVKYDDLATLYGITEEDFTKLRDDAPELDVEAFSACNEEDVVIPSHPLDAPMSVVPLTEEEIEKINKAKFLSRQLSIGFVADFFCLNYPSHKLNAPRELSELRLQLTARLRVNNTLVALDEGKKRGEFTPVQIPWDRRVLPIRDDVNDFIAFAKKLYEKDKYTWKEFYDVATELAYYVFNTDNIFVERKCRVICGLYGAALLDGDLDMKLVNL
jgi:hypothetical protein